VPSENRECGAQFEYNAEDGVTSVAENEYGKEACQHQTPYDVRRPGFGFSVSGFVLSVNADVLTLPRLLRPFFIVRSPYVNRIVNCRWNGYDFVCL
jgi:hypothetical protein